MHTHTVLTLSYLICCQPSLVLAICQPLFYSFCELINLFGVDMWLSKLKWQHELRVAIISAKSYWVSKWTPIVDKLSKRLNDE